MFHSELSLLILNGTDLLLSCISLSYPLCSILELNVGDCLSFLNGLSSVRHEPLDRSYTESMFFSVLWSAGCLMNNSGLRHVSWIVSVPFSKE
jgi:hypothetical protein